jgi:hypothetical protein
MRSIVVFLIGANLGGFVVCLILVWGGPQEGWIGNFVLGIAHWFCVWLLWGSLPTTK